MFPFAVWVGLLFSECVCVYAFVFATFMRVFLFCADGECAGVPFVGYQGKEV